MTTYSPVQQPIQNPSRQEFMAVQRHAALNELQAATDLLLALQGDLTSENILDQNIFIAGANEAITCIRQACQLALVNLHNHCEGTA
ncbi:MAG: hypothetical protein U1E62_11955 [Alsobacter sp.]